MNKQDSEIDKVCTELQCCMDRHKDLDPNTRESILEEVERIIQASGLTKEEILTYTQLNK